MYLDIHIVLAQFKVPLRNADGVNADERCIWSILQTSNGAEAEAVLLSPVSEVDVVSSPKESAEQNNRSTVNQQSKSFSIKGCLLPNKYPNRAGFEKTLTLNIGPKP